MHHHNCCIFVYLHCIQLFVPFKNIELSLFVALNYNYFLWTVCQHHVTRIQQFKICILFCYENQLHQGSAFYPFSCHSNITKATHKGGTLLTLRMVFNMMYPH